MEIIKLNGSIELAPIVGLSKWSWTLWDRFYFKGKTDFCIRRSRTVICKNGGQPGQHEDGKMNVLQNWLPT